MAAQRGHKVSLYEETDVLGGQLRLAGKPPHKEEITYLVDTTERQLRDLGVSIHLNRTLDVEDVRGLKPDAVVVAAGAVTSVPPVEGIHAPHVLTAPEALRNPAALKGNVVVIGGGSTGAETAEYLAVSGCKVAVVEMLKQVAHDLENSRRRILLESLSKKGVRLLVGAKVKRITGSEVQMAWCGDEIALPADYVVLSTGIRPRNDFENLREKIGVPVYYAGSCANPGPGLEALREGFEVGCAV